MLHKAIVNKHSRTNLKVPDKLDQRSLPLDPALSPTKILHRVSDYSQLAEALAMFCCASQSHCKSQPNHKGLTLLPSQGQINSTDGREGGIDGRDKQMVYLYIQLYVHTSYCV